MQAPAACRPAAVEGERDGEHGKEGGEDEAGFCQRAQFAVLPGEQGDAAVPQGEGERRPRRAVRDVLDEAVLQAVAAKRGRAEQGAVEAADALEAAQTVGKEVGQAGVVGKRRRVVGGEALPRVTPDDGGVKREVVEEEGLNAGELRRVVSRAAPTAGDGERAAEADEVERAPRLVAGDEGDAAVQEGEIGKEREVVVAAAGGQHRRGEAADEGDLRQHARVLHHGEGDQQRGSRGHQCEGDRRVEQGVQFQRGERGEVENGERRPLNGKRVIAAFRAQMPAGGGKYRGGRGNGAVAQRQGNVDACRGIAQKEGEAEEQNGDARFQQQVFAEEGGERRRRAVVRIIICGGGWRRCGTRTRRRLASGDESVVVGRNGNGAGFGFDDGRRRGFGGFCRGSNIGQLPIVGRGRRFRDCFRRRKMLGHLGADRLRRLINPQRQGNRNARLVGDLRLQLAQLAVQHLHLLLQIKNQLAQGGEIVGGGWCGRRFRRRRACRIKDEGDDNTEHAENPVTAEENISSHCPRQNDTKIKNRNRAAVHRLALQRAGR